MKFNSPLLCKSLQIWMATSQYTLSEKWVNQLFKLLTADILCSGRALAVTDNKHWHLWLIWSLEL